MFAPAVMTRTAAWPGPGASIGAISRSLMRKPRSDGRSYPMNDFLPVILTIVRQSWNEFMTNPFYPGIVTLMLGVRVSNFELDTISGIEKDLMVKLVTIGVHTRYNIEIIFLELVGDRVASFC